MRLKFLDDLRNYRHYESFEIAVRDISRRDQAKLGRSAGYQMRVYEIRVLGDDRSLFSVGNVNDLIVGGLVATR